MHALLFGSRRWVLFASAPVLALLVTALLMSGVLTPGGTNPLGACTTRITSGNTPNPPPTISSILVQDGVVYAGAYANEAPPHARSFIYALDARRGTLFWRYELVPPTFSIDVAAVAGGVVYVGVNAPTNPYSYEFTVLALRARDGQLLWNVQTGRIVTLTLAVSGGVVFATGTSPADPYPSSTLYALRASDGALLWQQPAPTGVVVPLSAPAIVGQVAYIYKGDADASSVAAIYALRVSDGAVLWSQPWQSRLASAFAAPLVIDGVLYTSVRSAGAVYALRGSDGAVLWHTRVDQEVISAPLMAGGLIYVIGAGVTGTGVDAGHTTLYALDARDGTPRWQRGAILLDGAAGGLVYLEGPDPTNATGGLFALDALSGAMRWVQHVDVGGVLVGPDAGVLYIEGGTDGGTTVQALNAATSHAVWRTPVAESDHPITEGSGGVYFAVGRYDPSPCTPQFKAGYLEALDARTGSFLWRFQTQGQSH